MSRPKTWHGSNVPMKFRSNTQRIASAGRSKNDRTLAAGRLRLVATCAVDQNVHAAKLPHHALGRAGERISVQYVGRHGHRPAALGLDLARHVFGPSRVDIQHGDRGTALRQRARHRAAQHPGSARHHSHLAAHIKGSFVAHRQRDLPRDSGIRPVRRTLSPADTIVNQRHLLAIGNRLYSGHHHNRALARRAIQWSQSESWAWA